MEIIHMYTDSLICPLGLDNPEPAFGWQYGETQERGWQQAAYRLQVADSRLALEEGHSLVWDTMETISRNSVHIRYMGPTLRSRTRYFWRVQVRDQSGCWHHSDIAWWETAMMSVSDWRAHWIGQTRDDGLADSKRPLPLYRRDFHLDQEVASARAYISGLGHYELSLNGVKVGNQQLAPGWTDYDKRVLYNVHDITTMLQAGDNAVGVMLGNGFFHVPGGRYSKFKDSFGLPRCLVQLEITYINGQKTTLFSDEHWQTSPGPIVFSCMYGGEDYDARLDQEGWNTAGYAATDWQQATIVAPPLGKLCAESFPAIQVRQRFRPVSVTTAADGQLVVDLGQNFSGWVRLQAKGKVGSTISIYPGELLDEQGIPHQKWTGGPCVFSYTLKGESTEQWAPRFSYSGFRYLRIEGAIWGEQGGQADPLTLATLLDIEGEMLVPDIKKIGHFSCSDSRINRIHEIINWAMLSNTKSVFTDCPHREKLGWLEQVHLMGPSLMYNYDIDALLGKVIDDIKEAQQDNGMIPTTAPEYVVFTPPWDMFRHAVSWAATYVLSPLAMYHRYGNTRILDEHYPQMQRYLTYLDASCQDHIITDGLGDWYDVGEAGPGFAQNTPVPLTETAMYFHLTEAMAEIASILGRTTDQEAYQATAANIRAAFRRTFRDPVTGLYGNGSQASVAMPLALGLSDADEQDLLIQHLVQDIAKHDGHTTVGDVAHRYLLQALSDDGRADLIIAMLQKTDYPSYGYQIEHGATSLTEAWDGPTVGKSQNHFMLGHIEEWFYRVLAGLTYQMDNTSGAYVIGIQPYLNNPIQWVKCEVRLPVGTISVSWHKYDNGMIELDVGVPANSSATLSLPFPNGSISENGLPLSDRPDVQYVDEHMQQTRITLGSGCYRFRLHAVNKS